MLDFLHKIPNLDAYGNPQYFFYLAIALIPVAVGIYRQRRFHVYEALVQFVFIFLMFTGGKVDQGLALLAYIAWEFVVVGSYLTYRKNSNNTLVFYLMTFLSILPLVIVKVSPALLGHNSLLGFIGISYLTFRSTGMVMTARDGVISGFNPWMFFKFVLFMPTFTSGPIDRYERFEKDYDNLPSQDEYLDMIQKAVWYIMVGFLFKFIIAYMLKDIAMPYVEDRALSRGGLSWSLMGYMYVYGLDLYFDFAGYSLFAVAISYIFGIKSPMNFNRPFISKNLKDFWNRWHISLSFWFRDFVFMRLTFTLMKKKVFKSRVTTANVAYILNMLLMGFWHGVTWYYIVYGLFHGLGLVINDAWLRYKRKHKNQIPHNKFTEIFAIFLTIQVVFVGFLIFSGFLDKLFFR
ncbi:D-alanyl-lipoteichoic acid biosynthesis protein DltB [Streptococcaceae bacterium ESL0687]|nr:D-alanyl-lipoteichoic acid biosynthesis protein DltB [Streptococcaceae bacterium ESL0687]